MVLYILSQPKEVTIQNTVATFMRSGGQNDLNQNGHCHQNIYITSNGTSNYNGITNGVHKKHNSVTGSASRTTTTTTTTTTLIKKLETTEL